MLLAVQFVDMRSKDFLAKGGRVLEPRDASRDPSSSRERGAVVPVTAAASPGSVPRSAADPSPVILQLIAELQARIASK